MALPADDGRGLARMVAGGVYCPGPGEPSPCDKKVNKKAHRKQAVKRLQGLLLLLHLFISSGAKARGSGQRARLLLCGDLLEVGGHGVEGIGAFRALVGEALEGGVIGDQPAHVAHASEERGGVGVKKESGSWGKKIAAVGANGLWAEGSKVLLSELVPRIDDAARWRCALS